MKINHPSFDPRGQFLLASPAMRMAIIFICLALAWMPEALKGQDQATNARPLTLQETVQLALQHNLDVQIERYNPRLALYTLDGSYGGYDPSFNLNGVHAHNQAGSQLLGGGFVIPGVESDTDTFTANLNGKTPWGMSYTLQGQANDAKGKNFNVDTNGLIHPSPFENTIASTSIKVTQPLLKNFLIDQTRLNIRVAKNRLKYSELGFKLRVMNTLATTEQAYYDLIYFREFVTVQQKAVELATRLVDENRKRVQVGALAPLDEQQAEAQAASAQADLISAQANAAIQEHLLKSLITDQYSQWATEALIPSDPLLAPRQFFSRQDSWSRGLALRPDFLQAKLDVEQAGIQLKFTRNQLLPELDAFGSYGYNGSGTEFSGALGDIASTDRPLWTVGGQLTLPLANTTARNNYGYSRATEQQFVLALKKMEQQILVQIDDSIRQAQSSFQRVGATRASREYADAALDAEQKKLESGKSTTYTVLQMQRDLTTARGNEIQALAAYNKALAQLSLNEGSILERLWVDLELK